MFVIYQDDHVVIKTVGAQFVSLTVLRLQLHLQVQTLVHQPSYMADQGTLWTLAFSRTPSDKRFRIVWFKV